MRQPIFFDSASTTPCCTEAIDLFRQYAEIDYGNPSSSHGSGQRAHRELHRSRLFFADVFKVDPEQVVFTGSGTEANNLALYGVASARLSKTKQPSHILASNTEHPSITRTLESLAALGVETGEIPVDSQGQILRPALFANLRNETRLLSIQHVNNVLGTYLPVEDLAREVKAQFPKTLFHTDAVQSFGKFPIPTAHSSIDLLSISGHKVHGPKGVGALIILNKKLLQFGLSPQIWGGGQENGFRSGTQNVGLIAGFRVAAEQALRNQKNYGLHVSHLNKQFKERLIASRLLNPAGPSAIRWNSPESASPYIVHLAAPGFPAGPLTQLLEERNCLVATGSACHSKKAQPDPVLQAMGFSSEIQRSSLRISFSESTQTSDLEALVWALQDSLLQMKRLL